MKKNSLSKNLVMDTDSYKFSHSNQYVSGASQMMSYFESRGGLYTECTLFGLQYLLHEYLSEPITKEMVDEAEAFAMAHGEPFNKNGWMKIVNEYNGKLPVKIRAIPEGTVVPVSNALLTIESVDDPDVFWIVSWLETMLVRLWYSSTIAITSRESKKILKTFLDKSSDNPESEIMFKLHDFGARGVATMEQARIGGAAHLLNFLGSDTIEGIRCANHYYDIDMAGFSIPATEHSTITMWGKDREYDAFKAYVENYLINREVPEGLPKLAACVSDSFNIYKAVEAWTTDPLLSMIKSSGGTLVIRPDSGEPIEVLSGIFQILEKNLGSEIKINSKGYKVLPDYFRVIQGDGIDILSMQAILEALDSQGWSASNIAFGSGGGLLQKVNRDTQKWAFKCCYAKVNGVAVDVRKNPITDSGKMSKGGRLDLIKENGEYFTVTLEDGQESHENSVMNLVYDNGEIKYHTTFEDCRKRMSL